VVPVIRQFRFTLGSRMLRHSSLHRLPRFMFVSQISDDYGNNSAGLLVIDDDGAAGADLSVKLQRVVKHLNVESFRRAVQFEIFWYSP
jgi:hypothetical protein